MRYQTEHRMSPAARHLEDMLARQHDVSTIAFMKVARENAVELTRADILAFADEHMHLDKAYTPDVVAEFMASVGMKHRPRTVLDPACGIGNLLYFCKSAPYLQGVDIDDTLTPAAYLVCPSADHRHADFLSTPRDHQFDLVIVHPPFGTHQPGQSTPLEQQILEKSLECLSPRGVLVALVPPSILWSASFSGFREKVLREYRLEAIIELWRGALQATAMGSAVVVISKRVPGRRVLARVAENGEALPDISLDYTEHTGHGWIPVSELTGDWHAATLAAGQTESENGTEYVKLSDLGDVSGGMALNKRLRSQAGTHLVFSFRHVEQGRLRPDREPCEYVSERTATKHERSILRPGDIVVALRYSPGKLYQAREEDPPCVVPAGYAVVRSSMSGYLHAYLSIPSNQQLLTKRTSDRSTGLTIRGITVSSLKDLRIPVLPLDNLGDLNQHDLEFKSQRELEVLTSEVREITQKFENGTRDSGFMLREDDRSTTAYATQAMITARPHAPKRAHVCEPLHVPVTSVKTSKPMRKATLDSVSGLRNDDDIRSLLATLTEEIHSMNGRLRRVEKNTGTMVQLLTHMTVGLHGIKTSSDGTEEVLRRMADYLDSSLDQRTRRKEAAEKLGSTCSLLLSNWDRLESGSQKLLMDAEFLLGVLSRSPDHDYSPCVLEYCRSLENELLNKLFKIFVPVLQHGPQDVAQSVTLAAADRDNDDCTFARLIKPCIDGEEPMKITLGQMTFELQRAVKPRSPLSKAFRKHLECYTATEFVLSKSFLSSLREVAKKYRNPCAHVDLVDKSCAMDCRRFLLPQIDLLLGTLRG